MSAATHPEASMQRPRRARGWSTTVALLGTGALLVSACGSGSNADASSVASASVEPAASTEPVEDTTPETDPAATDPPATDAPTTVAPTTTEAIAYPIVVEGTTTHPKDKEGQGEVGPDGSHPYYNLKVFDGGLVGEASAVGSWAIVDDSIEGSEVVDFTGDLVGVGSGTFTSTDEFSITFDGSFTATAEIVGTGGAFENLVGTIEYTSPDFGANRTFRATFTPVDEVAGEQVADAAAEAAGIADEIATSFTARDFVSIQDLLGSDGTWVAIDGEVHDASTLVSFLEQFGFIETIERTDRFIEVPDGVAFEMSETFEGGGQGTFWLVVSYDDMGALMITELAEAPQG